MTSITSLLIQRYCMIRIFHIKSSQFLTLNIKNNLNNNNEEKLWFNSRKAFVNIII